MTVRDVQPLNALLPMVVMLFGIVIEVNVLPYSVNPAIVPFE